MIDVVIAGLALAVCLAYVCRVDLLSWRQHPALFAVHVVGGWAALRVLTCAGDGVLGGQHLVMLAASAALLAVTYRLLPRQKC